MGKSSRTVGQQKRDFLEQLIPALGVVTTAAAAANVPRSTVYQWLKDDKKFRAAVEDVGEVELDFGETQQRRLMQGYTLPDCQIFMVDVTTTTVTTDGEGREVKTVKRTKEPRIIEFDKHVGPNQRAVEFFLSTKGKKRGYDNKLNVKVAGLGKLKIVRVTQKPAPPGGTLSVTRGNKSKE